MGSSSTKVLGSVSVCELGKQVRDLGTQRTGYVQVRIGGCKERYVLKVWDNVNGRAKESNGLLLHEFAKACLCAGV